MPEKHAQTPTFNIFLKRDSWRPGIKSATWSNIVLPLIVCWLAWWGPAECTIQTKHLVPYKKHKNLLPKRIDPNFIIINLTFHNFKNRFFQIKSDLNLKTYFLTIDFGHKGQSGVLAQTCSVWRFTSKNCLKICFA